MKINPRHRKLRKAAAAQGPDQKIAY